MAKVHFLSNILRSILLLRFRLQNLNKKDFSCPICNYSGPFKDFNPSTGVRKHAQCPNCGSLERHRIQYLVLQIVLKNLDTHAMVMLHFAPENFLRDFFSERFHAYETADLMMNNVDHRVDLQNLPFEDSTYDFVFASHVLEHIPNDIRAVKEIRRILKPDGIAILPVPLVGDKTIEYPEPNPHDANHVRAPGWDYYDRFVPFFEKIEKFASDSLPEKYQLYIYEDRSRWPNAECPLRPAQAGAMHKDIVPVCYVSKRSENKSGQASG